MANHPSKLKVRKIELSKYARKIQFRAYLFTAEFAQPEHYSVLFR